MKPELSKRLLNFSVDIILLLRKFPNSAEYKVIKYQLIKSSSSAGANYEETQGGSPRKDFKNKVLIALKEMRESNYWLKIIKEINNAPELDEEITQLGSESGQIKKILGAIAAKINLN